MMKKIIIALTLILVLSAGSMYVFADSAIDNEALGWFRERMGYRREALSEAFDEKAITQEEYNSWSEHFDYMEEFHEENGFGPGGFGPGGCHGRGANGTRGFGNRMMRGFARDMMRRYVCYNQLSLTTYPTP